MIDENCSREASEGNSLKFRTVPQSNSWKMNSEIAVYSSAVSMTMTGDAPDSQGGIISGGLL